MNAPTPFQLALRRSTITHVVLVAAVVIWPAINNLIQNRDEEPEDFVLIDLKMTMDTPEPMVARPRPEPPKPEPPKPEPPKPEPPKPEPPKPEPPKPEPPKPPQPAPGDTIRDTAAKPPTNTLRKAHEVKISTTRVAIARSPGPVAPPRGPQISEEDFRRLVNLGVKEGDHNSLPGGDHVSTSLFANYYVYLRNTMYSVWQQPENLAGSGLVTQVRIRIARDGTILSRTKARGSGHGVMDDSVMRAVNSVSKLRPLPSGYTADYRDITVDFELTGAGP